jgi:hypothetical protein
MSALNTVMAAGGVLLVALAILRKRAAVGRQPTRQAARPARLPTFAYVFMLWLEGLLPSVIVLAILALSNVTAFAPLLRDLSDALALLAHALT